MMTRSLQTKKQRLHKQYWLVALLVSYLVICLHGLYEALSTGGCPLFFVLKYFMVVKSENEFIYWVHTLMGFGVIGVLTSSIARASKDIKTLRMKP